MKYRRVFLIEPRYPGSYYPNPVWPVGLGYIAASLAKAGIEHRALDLKCGHTNASLIRKIAASKSDLIGLSLMTSQYRSHYRLISYIKARLPAIPIVVGGPHVSTFRDTILDDCPEIDYGVPGEGEEAIVELCNGTEPARIPGLLYRTASGIAYSGDRKRCRELDGVAYPTFEGFEIDRYDTRSVNILSSRGCPYRCTFCPVHTVSGHEWRGRSAANVVDEIEYWYGRSYRIFNFNDDAFNVDRKRVLEICREIKRRELSVELNAPNGIRADKADREVLEAMKQAGFRHIAYGVEAGTNKVLSAIRKGETIEVIERSIRNACELGYDVALFFLIGSPGETKEDIEASFQLAAKYPITDVRFYNLIPFPKTELYDWVRDNRYFVSSSDRYLNGAMHWSPAPVFATPELPVGERKRLFRRGLRMGNRLRSRYLFDYYRKGFFKLPVAGKPLAYLLSRQPAQALLRLSGMARYLRIELKKRGIFRQA